MIEKIKSNGLDLKWFANLTKDQQLTVWLIVVIFTLSGVCAHLYNVNEKNKIAADLNREKIIGKLVQKHEIERALMMKEINDCKNSRFDDAIFFREKFFELKNEIK